MPAASFDGTDIFQAVVESARACTFALSYLPAPGPRRRTSGFVVARDLVILISLRDFVQIPAPAP